jgi:hypothetical protein
MLDSSFTLPFYCLSYLQVKIHYTYEGDLSVVATISANVSNIDFIMRGLPGQPESKYFNLMKPHISQ